MTRGDTPITLRMYLAQLCSPDLRFREAVVQHVLSNTLPRLGKSMSSAPHAGQATYALAPGCAHVRRSDRVLRHRMTCFTRPKQKQPQLIRSRHEQ